MRFWYIPVEIFHRLNDIDKVRQKAEKSGIIESIHFIPSSQRILYHQLKLLTAEELKIFNALVNEGVNSISRHLAKLTSERQILVLDGLLAYQQYRLISEEPNPSRDRKKFKNQILLARLQLPSSSRPSPQIPLLPSPAEGSRPMELGFSIAIDANEDPFLRLSWSPYKKEIVGKNSLEGDEFVVFDLAVGFFEDDHKAFVDQFDLIRILNLKTLSVAVDDESQLSWQLRIGMTRMEKNDKNQYDGIASFGAGYAWRWDKLLIGYGMVDLAAHSLDPYVRLRPHLGLKFDLGELRTWMYFGGESNDYNMEMNAVWGGKLQYQFNRRYALDLEISNEKATRASLGLNWYW